MNLIFGQGTKIPHAAEQLIPGIRATEPHTLESVHNSQLERVPALQQKIPQGDQRPCMLHLRPDAVKYKTIIKKISF